MATYTVLHFSANPDTDESGDKVIASWDFETRDEAMVKFREPIPRDVAYVGIDAPDFNISKRNLGYSRQALDAEARRELAMEAGMLHGTQAYNEIMGYDAELDDEYPDSQDEGAYYPEHGRVRVDIYLDNRLVEGKVFNDSATAKAWGANQVALSNRFNPKVKTTFKIYMK